MARKVRVAVIGGGLGGLCAGSALLHHGHEVHVYEAAPQLLEVGGGLTYNHLSSPFAIWKRELTMKLRRMRRRTGQRDWIASYDAGAPDVLERVTAG